MKKDRRKEILPNSSALINLFADASLLCFSKRRAISRFGCFIFGITQLEDWTRRGGVVVCIQGLGGEIRCVHSAWFVNVCL
jgi:hypothetical protein